MKYLILVPDGMADYPLEQLDGKTPMEVAETPNMDRLARASQMGITCHVPDGMPPGSAVANMSIMGYDPKEYYTGRAPIEAASMGIRLGDNVAYRCNLVTVQEGKMADFTAGHISSEEAKEIINTLNEKLGDQETVFHPGKSYRHLLVTSRDRLDCQVTPPHDISGQSVEPHLPRGAAACWVREITDRSKEILKDHPVNVARRKEGSPPATQIWLWGQGTEPSLPAFKDRYGLQGAVITAVDLVQGLGRLIGFQVQQVPGATGFVDTNYEGKAQAAVRALDEVDVVYLHVEAPDEAGHMGDVNLKIKAIEDFDKRLLSLLLKQLDKPYRIILQPDHPTPIATKTHATDPVPFLIHDSNWAEVRTDSRFSEKAGKQWGLWVKQGHCLLEQFFFRKDRA